MSLYRLYEFLFDRWTVSIIDEGKETWTSRPYGIDAELKYSYTRYYVKYKLTNKFDGSVKIKKKYI